MSLFYPPHNLPSSLDDQTCFNCSVLSNSVTPWTVAHQTPLSMEILQRKNIGVGFHALLQGIFPTQGSNPGLPHCRWILYHLSHQGRYDEVQMGERFQSSQPAAREHKISYDLDFVSLWPIASPAPGTRKNRDLVWVSQWKEHTQRR